MPKHLTPESVFSLIGHFGFIQKIYIFFIVSLQIFGAYHMVLNIFTGMFFTCFELISKYG